MGRKTTCRESSGFPKFSLGTLFLKLTVFQKQGVHSSNRHGLIENHFHSMAQYAKGPYTVADKICLAQPNISTKITSAKFSIL